VIGRLDESHEFHAVKAEATVKAMKLTKRSENETKK